MACKIKGEVQIWSVVTVCQFQVLSLSLFLMWTHTNRGELELRIEGNNAVGTLSVTNGAIVGKSL